MFTKKTTESVAAPSPKKEEILTVLYRYGTAGIYNLHLLDEIQAADKAVGRKQTSLGTFYPTVKRLEEEGLIEGFWDDQEIAPGVKRRYLKITGSGVTTLIAGRKHRAILAGQTLPANDLLPAPSQYFGCGGEG
jgi:PadR family transcriptional regulator, regulatory protein PadR